MNRCPGGKACVINQPASGPYAPFRKHLEELHGVDMRTHQEKLAQENIVNKSTKAARKSLKKSLAQAQASATFAGQVRKAEDEGLARIRQLESTLKKQLAESLGQGVQEGYGTAFALHREKAKLAALRLAKAGVPPMDAFARLNAYMANPNASPAASEAARNQAAQDRAIAGVQGDNAVNRPVISPRTALADIVGGVGEPEHLQTSDLPSQVDLHRLQKALQDARTPAAREAAGYAYSRASLIRAHMLGEA